LKIISEYYQNFLKKVILVRKEVKEVKTEKFVAYLVAIFLLPGGSILCLIALYYRIIKND
tara:strand:+ start:292 stop:471 length:180 start_codon:yes stop_codon:yes gene_type:complete